MITGVLALRADISRRAAKIVSYPVGLLFLINIPMTIWYAAKEDFAWWSVPVSIGRDMVVIFPIIFGACFLAVYAVLRLIHAIDPDLWEEIDDE